MVSNSDSETLNNKELTILQRLLDKYSQERPSEKTPCISLAQTSTERISVLSVIAWTNNIWVIDSRATDHLIEFQELFFDFRPYSKHTRVQVANNTHAKIMGSGIAIISPNVILTNTYMCLTYNVACCP